MSKKQEETDEVVDDNEDWFHTGDDADAALDADEARRKAQQNNVFRWWLPPDKSNHLTFVDSDPSPHGYEVPFSFMEHNLYLNASWRNWFTCIQGIKGPDGKKQECPLCKAGNTPYLASAYTVIDHSEWKDKSGNVHKDEKKLFVCKSQVQKVLRKAATKKKGLRGWKVEVTRTGEKSPNTGDQFDFEERCELPDDVQAYNYRQEFKPKTAKELMEIIGDVQSDGSDEEVRF